MLNKFQATYSKIEPIFWQEISRISRILLFTGWISLYYTRMTDAPVDHGLVWLLSSLIVLAAAFFGNQYRQTIDNHNKILTILLPGFLLSLLLSLQLMRYPDTWPFFGAMWENFSSSMTINNLLPVDFWHLLYLLYLTWRGLVIGRVPADSQAQQKAFLGFIIAFILFQIILAPKDQASLLPYFSGIFLLGLIGLPAGRIVTVSMFRGGRLPKVRASWVYSILGLAAIIFCLGLGISLILNLSLAKIAASLLISAVSGLIYLLFLALSPIAYLIMLILSNFLEKLLSGTEMEVPEVLMGQNINDQAQIETQEAVRQSLLSVQNILLITVALVMLLIIWRTLKRKPWENKKELVMEEGLITKEPIPKFKFPLDLQALRDKLNLKPGKGLSALRIRWIYATLCYYGRLLGSPRKPAVTPLEYQGVLHLLFPEEQIEIQEITNAYIAVRYGNIPENAADILKIQACWRTVETKARQNLHFLKQRKTRKSE
jgi:hypothetical protein